MAAFRKRSKTVVFERSTQPLPRECRKRRSIPVGGQNDTPRVFTVPFPLNRKNALFVGHNEGGRTWARVASLIETCKLNAVEPYTYLKATLEAIAAGHPSTRIDELTLWNFDKQS
jgi:hypothetical protein